MAIRFQKRFKIAPGVKINLSRSGISTTLGVKGAAVNIGKKGVYGNASLPGTGLSSRTRLDKPQTADQLPKSQPKPAQVSDSIVPYMIFGAVMLFILAIMLR